MIDLAPFIARATAPRLPPAVGPGDIAALEHHLDRLIRHEMRWAGVAGVSLALVDCDRVLLARGFGLADREHGVPATAETVYRLASLSKPFTAAVVLRLAELRGIDLDAPLAAYLPGFAIRSRFADPGSPTLRTILAHRSGLPNLWRQTRPNGEPVPFNALLPEIAATYLVQPPGLLTKYSSLGYNLLGHMVEAVSGRPFATAARELLFAPLGAATASYAPTHVLLARLARGHRGGRPAARLPSLASEIPAGGLHASVLDIARFQRLFLADGRIDGRPILSPASVAAMLTPVQPALPLDIEEQVGLGWQLSLQPGLAHLGPIAAHGGAEFLFHSVAMLSPDLGIGVAVCANSSEGRALVYRVATTAMRLAATLHRERPPAGSVPAPAADWRRALGPPRAGRYQTLAGVVDVGGRGDLTEVHLHGRRFRLRRAGGGWFSLRYLLLGAVPLPIPVAQLAELRLGFAEIAGRAVLIADADGQVRRLGELLPYPHPIPAAWQARAGDYELADPELAPHIFRTRPHLRLRLEAGWFIARTHPAIHPAIELSWVILPVTDSEAVFAGFCNFLGGETILAKGGTDRICFSGYEFVRMQP